MQPLAISNGGLFNPTLNRTIFIGLSILIHGILIISARTITRIPSNQIFDKEINLVLDTKSDEKPTEAPPPPTNLRQIVSPSDTQETKEVPKTNLLSDKNTKVENQQIKRGDIPNVTHNQKEQINIAKNKTESKSKAPENSQLNKEKSVDTKNILAGISQATLNSLSESSLSKVAPNIKDTDEVNETEQNSLAASENRLNSLAGITGNPDLVTNIRDGELTLLNAKADRFAVFVRRVALQVFSALRTSNWYETGDISRGFETEEITARATLDQKGKLLQVELIQSSKTNVFDKVLLKSIQKGAWDKNPPPQALTPDGKIKFIFKSRAAVHAGPQGRSRQWIMLATGLE